MAVEVNRLFGNYILRWSHTSGNNTSRGFIGAGENV